MLPLLMFPEYTPAIHVRIPKGKELCQEAVSAVGPY